MSTWTFTCRNHPQLRWTKNKCGPGFIGHGVLLFQGDLETGKESSPFSETFQSLARKAPEYRQHFSSRYAPECDCPASDLVVVAEELIPFKVTYIAPHGVLAEDHV